MAAKLKSTAKTAEKLEAPLAENGKVVRFPIRARETRRAPSPPRRVSNLSVRSREYLTPKEMGKLLLVAKEGRYGHRDSTLLLIGYRHGLRVSELVGLRWDQFDLTQGLFHVNRLKRGNPSTHPLAGIELRALKQLRREWPDSPFVFCSERGGPMTAGNVRKLLTRCGDAADLGFPIHPHMLRHGCGFKLANDGQDTRAIQLYLGHRNIQHSVRYTELSPERFKNFWKD